MNTAVGVLIVTFVFIGLVDHGPANLLRRAGLVLIRWGWSIQRRQDSVVDALDAKEIANRTPNYVETSLSHFCMDEAIVSDWNDPEQGCMCAHCTEARQWFQISRINGSLVMVFKTDSPGAEDSLEQARRSA